MASSKRAPKASYGQATKTKAPSDGDGAGAPPRKQINRGGTVTGGGGGSRRAPRRRSGAPRYLWGVVAAVVVVVVALVAYYAAGGGAVKQGKTGTMPLSVVNSVTSVPDSTLTSIGIGASSGSAAVTPPIATAGIGGTASQPPLTANGLPEVLFVGAEYCPYCAAERWAFVNALGRFGTWSNLGQTTSSATDVFANTPTFDFYQSGYTSKYLTLQTVELETNTGKPLQQATSAQTALINQYDSAPYVTGSSGSIPFIDFGNQYIQSGASFSPGVLGGLDVSGIAAAMGLPGTTVAQTVDATANYFTAAICAITDNQPGSVCNQPYIAKAIAAAQAAAKQRTANNNATPGGATGQ